MGGNQSTIDQGFENMGAAEAQKGIIRAEIEKFKSEQPLSDWTMDILYLLNIFQYICLTYTTVILLQAEKVSDTKYCLKNFSASDKVFFNFAGYYMGIVSSLLPLLVMLRIYFRNRNKVNIELKLAQARTVVPGSRTSIIVISVSVLLLLALAIMLYVYLGIMGEVNINQNEKGGYCLEFDLSSDYGYVKAINSLAWFNVIFTTVLLVYL